MADDSNLVNVGSAERPVIVPKKALEPETPEGNEWWGMVADGSVEIGSEDLDELLKVTKK